MKIEKKFKEKIILELNARKNEYHYHNCKIFLMRRFMTNNNNNNKQVSKCQRTNKIVDDDDDPDQNE